ncbi:MAG: phenylalanine--tRNA ligase subunit beta, partial [Bacteroidota bacterium]
MKIALNWLEQYIEISESVETLGHQLTSVGLEVEHIYDFEQIPGNLEGIVIGEVITCERHPNADKLSVTTVDIGAEAPVPIVCGAPNVAAGQKVAVATVNAMIYPLEGEPFKIKKAKIRGEVSQGMICAEDELSLGKSHNGIMVLDTDLPNGHPARDYFQPFTDKVIEIGLTPNRADAASHLGVARDLKALYEKDLSMPSVDDFKIDSSDLNIEVLVENEEACPRYAGLSIKGVNVSESPTWLQNRLKSIGLTPINNVVDVTNFVLHELGQPLHAFDADEIKGGRIRVKTLPKDTPFVTLDEQERKLSDQDLMICDDQDTPLCIAGVFGGLNSGVSDKTRHVFLECAYFSPAYVRKTSQFHGLKTDASFRYERGTDPNLPVYALKRAALLIQEVAGGSIASEIKDIYPQAIGNFEFRVKYKHIDRLIGKKLEKDFIKRKLNLLEIEISDENEVGFQVSVPPYRVDVTREADIIEDIARLYGYDNLMASPNLGASYLAEFPNQDAHKLQFQISQLLAANGFSEMLNNSLTRPGYIDQQGYYKSEDNVMILNRLSEELGVMRQTLLFSGLEVLAYNINRRQKELKFFEFGKTYFLESDKEQQGLDQYREESHLSIFITGNKQAQSWLNPVNPKEAQKSQSDFFDLQSAVQKVLQRLGIMRGQSQPLDHPNFAYGLSYKVKDQEIAHLGLLKKSISEALGIQQDVFFADLDWDYLWNHYESRVK